jgi:hypothetical protein
VQEDAADIGSSGQTRATKRYGELISWDWRQDLHDWIDLDSGELLSGYDLSVSNSGA